MGCNLWNHHTTCLWKVHKYARQRCHNTLSLFRYTLYRTFQIWAALPYEYCKKMFDSFSNISAEVEDLGVIFLKKCFKGRLQCFSESTCSHKLLNLWGTLGNLWGGRRNMIYPRDTFSLTWVHSLTYITSFMFYSNSCFTAIHEVIYWPKCE